MRAYWKEKHSDRHTTPNSCSGCSSSESINAGCSCTKAEQVVPGVPAASCGEISKHPSQPHSALKRRTRIQEEHMHSPDIMYRTKAVCVPSVRTENYPLFLVLAQGEFSPAVNLRILLCPWARVYLKVSFEDVRTDSQDLDVGMFKTWSVLQRAGMCSQVPAVWSGKTRGTIFCWICSVLRMRIIQVYVSEKLMT